MVLVHSLHSAVRDFGIARAEKIGRDIYEQDALAAEATDILFAAELDLANYPIKGWLVVKEKSESTVIFVGKYEDEYVGFFEVVKKGKRKGKLKQLNKRELTPDELSAFRARELALDYIDEPCSSRYNTVVLNNPEGEGFLVYALAATQDPEAVQIGGHYRFMVAKDGSEIASKERLSSSCLVLDKKPDDMPPGAKLSALTMSHLVSERPLEIHVFQNLLHELDFYVATPDGKVWKIHEGKIEAVR